MSLSFHLILLHSERPKLHTIFAFLGAIRSKCWEHFYAVLSHYTCIFTLDLKVAQQPQDIETAQKLRELNVMKVRQTGTVA